MPASGEEATRRDDLRRRRKTKRRRSSQAERARECRGWFGEDRKGATSNRVESNNGFQQK